MARLPISIGILALACALVGSAAFALDADTFDPVAAVVLLIGVGIVSLTGFIGLVLVRAPWGRWTLLVVVAIGLVLASIVGGWAFWTTLFLGGLATIGLTGPWLRLWLRQSTVADAPGPVVVALIALAPVATLWVGASTGGGFGVIHAVLIVVAVTSSWAYGRGQSWGLWSLKTLYPIVGLGASMMTTGPGAVLLAAGTIGVTILAWLPHAERATAVITPPLPPPVSRTTKEEPGATE
ncbi:MAG: hypothetical protein M3132_11380 [Actinomycetia bacterium]|nr:hypothetical protein [Actinomycetes bacterium]